MQYLLTTARWPFLALLAAATLYFAVLASRVGVERNNESLNIHDADQVATYSRFKKSFGNDEDLLLAVHMPNLLDAAGMQRIDTLSRRIAGLDNVQQVFSLTTAKQIIHGDSGAEEAPLVTLAEATDNDAGSIRTTLDRNPDFTGWLISADRQTAGITIEIEEHAGDDSYRATLIATLRSLMAEYSTPGVSLHLTGIAVQINDVTTFIDRDQVLLIPLAFVMLAIVLALFFRNLLGVVLPLAVTAISVVTTLGLYHLAGHSVNAITALLPPVIMVLSIAASVHLIQGWLQAPHGDNLQNIRHVVDELWFPCFFCALTTALGFASLMVAEIPAVRQFGMFAALGVSISFVVALTLVPVGLTFVTRPVQPFASPQHRLLRAGLEWSATMACRWPLAILLIFIAITALSAAGIPLIRNNTDLVRFLKSDAPLFRDTMFIDTHLTGTSAFDFMIERVDQQPLTNLDDVNRIAALESAVRELRDVTNTTTIVAALRQLQRGESGGELTLPDNARDLGYLFDLLDSASDRALINKLISTDFRTARLTVRLHSVGTAVAAPLADEIVAAGRHILGPDYTLTPTGAFYYVARDSNRLVNDQTGSFGVGLLAVFVAIGLFFRSLKPTLISMVPNVMPILWTAGLMGVFGIDLSTGTAMIASAVIGLVVDDTIHYLAHYYRSYRGDAVAAVRQTTNGIGSALVMNNLILVLGFWVGCFGSFKPTIYFSLLSGFTMITAMVCDLFLTPALLILLDRQKPKAPVHAR